MNDTIKQRVYRVVAVDKAGGTYEVYLKDMRDAIIANESNPERLEEIRKQLIGLRGIVEELQYRNRLKKISAERERHS